ncbi:MAG: isochorismate synthase [Ignavibacteriaceae bacterium]|nr:isochorismate synthase [Ignavibacteriaceae bacterium]
MTIVPGKIADNFSSFLSERSSIIGKQEFADYLISFKFSIEATELLNNPNYLLKNYPKVFYFENPNEKISFIAFGSAMEISENGLGRFSSLSKTYKEIKGKTICNWDQKTEPMPLVCGGMKFTPEHSEDEWIDFKDSEWFVPEFLIMKNQNSFSVLYNFLNQSSSPKKLIEKFTQRVETFNNFQFNKENNSVKILSTKGLSPKDKKKWKILVSDALDKMNELSISKIVASRRVDLVLSEELNWTEIRDYFNVHYPDCYFFFFRNNNSIFFGATPERLIRIHDKKIIIDAMAGSIVRGKTEEEDKKLESEMLSSSKLNHEHDLVVHQFKRAIAKYVTKIFTHKVPFKKLHNIQHLHTSLQSELLEDTNLFEVLEAIYPTAAVCGEPRDKALSLLKKLELHKRGLYSGIIGYFNFFNDGEFFIGIRSALFHENKLYVYAGSGLVEGSDPEDEFEETEVKLNAILNFFDGQNKNK